MGTSPARAAALLLALAALTACTDSTGGSTTTGTAAPTAGPTASATPEAPPTSGPVHLADLTAPSCLTDTSFSPATSTVTLVPCTEPHRSELYAITTLTGEFPGVQETATTAEAFCYEAFTSFVGVPLESSLHDFVVLHPSAQSWEAGDRAVHCLALGAAELTSTLAGTAE